MRAWIAHLEGPALLGPVPDGVTVEVCPSGPDGGAVPPSDPAGVQFWTPPFLAGAAVVELTARMPDLQVIQLLSAGADAWVGRVPPGVALCDARGVHDSPTAEWVVAAMLAHLRSFPEFIRAQVDRRWAYRHTDELAGKRVLIVGAGSIGEAVARRLEPFDVSVVRVARQARPGVHPVADLPHLLPHVDVVVVLVPLTAATTGLVDAAFLAAMPDGALLVNAARGPVVDTGALTAEVTSGRLAAALDVTDPEPLPPDHPLWAVPDLLLTPHVAASVPGTLRRAYRLVGDQLRRHAAGEPLANVVTGEY